MGNPRRLGWRGFFREEAMIAENEDNDRPLSQEAKQKLRQHLETGARTRLSRIDLDGRVVWVKRFDVEPKPLGKKLHSGLSSVLPFSVLRASPSLDAAGLADREARKSAQFRAAGLATPAILHREPALLVMSEVHEIVQGALQRLVSDDPGQHDAMLIQMAGALGKAHAKGLCHGRPYPRDIFRQDDATWGFLDFEEEPEAAMPLGAAQARDVWLMFMEITRRARAPETPFDAFTAWREPAPEQALVELRRLVGFMGRFVPMLRGMKPLGLGNDGLRGLGATTFLRSVLAEQPAAASAAENTKSDEIGTPT